MADEKLKRKLGTQSKRTNGIPRLYFEHAFALDTALPDSGGQNEALWDELLNLIPSMERQWKSGGEPLLEETVKLLGKKFGREELSIALSLNDLPSMSYPLVVNVRSLLPSAVRPKSWPHFFTTVHHELLHRYLNENFSTDVFSRSPLLQKYINRGERQAVTSHLHLFAVQIEVYSQLGRKAELEDVDPENKEYTDANYKRAWDIVTRLESKEAFLSELMN